MQRHMWWAIMLALGGVTAVHAEDRLAWKFKEGDKFYVETVGKTKQTIEVMGQKQSQEMDLLYVYRVTVKKSTDAGTVLQEDVISVQGKGQGGLDEAIRVMEKMKGAVFTITLGPDGRVSKVEGYDALIKRLSKDDSNAAKMLPQLVGEKSLKEGAGELFSFLPAKPVAKGARWDHSQEMPIGPLGTIRVKNQYTYLGKDKENARIEGTAELSYLPPDKENKDSPLQLTKGTLKDQSYKRSILFDPVRGRVVRFQIKMAGKFALTAMVMNQTLDLDLDMEISGTVRVLDKSPTDN